MRSLPLRLGPKLNLSLLAFILLLGTATATLVLIGFHRSQDNAAQKSREGLEREGIQQLQLLSSQQSYIGELQLSPAAEWGHQAGTYMELEGRDAPPVLASTFTLAPNGMLYDSGPNRSTDLALPAGVEVTPAVLADAASSSVLDQFFLSLFTDYEGRMIEEAFRPIAIFYISNDGLARYFPPTGKILEGGLSRDEISALHQKLGAGQNPGHRTIWTTPYEGEAGRGLVLTAYTPVYDSAGYNGVIGVDVALDLLTQQVQEIAPTPGGFGFYVDRDGQFLRTEQYEMLNALAGGKDDAFRSAVDQMMRGIPGSGRFTLNGREMVVAYSPMPTVGGSLALVAPTEELTAEAAGVTESIQSEGNRTTGFIILVMALLFVLALVSTAWLNRRILLSPIESLVSGTRAVAAGNFNASIPVRSRDELGDLAASFNRMIQEVRTRNDALVREITEREQTARALAEREESTRQIFQSVSDAILITDMEDHIVDANVAAQETFGYTVEELRALPPFALVAPGAVNFGKDFLQAIMDGRQYRARISSLRKDGTSFWTQVFATRAMYFGAPHVLQVIRDITEEVEQQQLLEQRVEERTRELSLLLGVSNAVASTLDMQQLFALVMDQVAEVLPFSRGSVLVLDGDSLVSQYVRGPMAEGEAFPVELPRFPVSGLRNSLAGLLAGEPVAVDDVRGDSPFARDFRWMTGDLLDSTFRQTVSWLGLPMVHKGRFIGVLAVSSEDAGAFSERYANLGMAIANQAAIAIDNARLFAEAERRASEMTALSRIATTLDLEQSIKGTLDSVAQRVVESTGAVAASVSTTHEDGSLALGGQYGLPAGFFDAIEASIRGGGPRPNLRALRRHEPVIVRDVRNYVATEEAYASLRKFSAEMEWDTIVIVPMRYADRDLGTLESYYRAGETPDEREIGLISAMARQAATAIENAMLFSQTEKRVRQLEALTQIASSFSLELSLPDLMDRMADQIVHASTAVAAAVTLAEGPSQQMRVIGASGVPAGFTDSLETAYRGGGGTTWRRALAERRTIFQPNLRAERVDDPRYDPVRPHLQSATWDSALLSPILFGTEALGVLMLGYPLDASPDEEERKFVDAVADQTGLVIENSRLYQRASAAAALEERQRLARELHDSVSQALYGIALGARTARRRIGEDAPANVTEPLEYVLSLAEAGLTEMRALIFELRPESIAQEGMIAAIGRQVAATQARYGVRVMADLCNEPDVSLDVKEALYRIAQESMHNTVKHARATKIHVSLAGSSGNLVLEITDNGQGFDTSGEFPGHLGLRSMKERAREIGGELAVESAPGEGTTIRLVVPLEGAAPLSAG